MREKHPKADVFNILKENHPRKAIRTTPLNRKTRNRKAARIRALCKELSLRAGAQIILMYAFPNRQKKSKQNPNGLPRSYILGETYGSFATALADSELCEKFGDQFKNGFMISLHGLDSSSPEGESSDQFASGALNGVVEGIRGALHKRFILEGESGLLAHELSESMDEEEPDIPEETNNEDSMDAVEEDEEMTDNKETDLQATHSTKESGNEMLEVTDYNDPRSEREEEMVDEFYSQNLDATQAPTTKQNTSAMSEAQMSVISELFPGRDMNLSDEEWEMIETTLLFRGIPLLWEPKETAQLPAEVMTIPTLELPIKAIVNEEGEVGKNLSAEEAGMSPLRHDGPLAKEVIEKSHDTRPTETQKVGPLKSNGTGRKALVGKPTIGAPIQDKRNADIAEAHVRKKHAGQGAEMSPPLKVTSDKIGTKLCNNILPRVIVIPKLVQTSIRTDGTALARKSTLGSPIQDKRIDRAEMLKKLSKPGAEMSPIFKGGVTVAKKGTKLADDIPPRVIPKLIEKSIRTDGTALVGKPTLGSPIQDKPNAAVLKKPSGRGSEVASICNSSNLTEKNDSTGSSKVSIVAQKSFRAEETTVRMKPAATESLIQMGNGGVGVPPLKQTKREMIKLTAAGKQVFDELFAGKKRIPPNFVEMLNKELSKRSHPPATVIETPKVALNCSHGTTGMTPATDLPAQVKAVDIDTTCVVETPKVAQKSGHLNSGTTGMVTSETGSSALEKAVNVCIAGVVGTEVTPKLSHVGGNIVGGSPVTKPKKAAIKLTAEGAKVLAELFPDKKLPPNFMDILNVELCKRGIPSATVGIGNSGVSENPNANQKLNHMSGTKVLMMPETGSLSRISELTVGLSRPDLLPRKPLQNLEKNVTSIKRKNPFEEDVNDPARQKIHI